MLSLFEIFLLLILIVFTKTANTLIGGRGRDDRGYYVKPKPKPKTPPVPEDPADKEKREKEEKEERRRRADEERKRKQQRDADFEKIYKPYIVIAATVAAIVIVTWTVIKKITS